MSEQVVDEKVVDFETVVALALNLSPLEKVRLIEQLAATLAQTMTVEPVKKPKRSLRGLLADLGPAPSAEEIDEARREMWANFPREEFFK